MPLLYSKDYAHGISEIQAYCVFWCPPDIPQCPSTIELYVPTEEHYTQVGTNAYSYTPRCARSSQTQGGLAEARYKRRLLFITSCSSSSEVVKTTQQAVIYEEE